MEHVDSLQLCRAKTRGVSSNMFTMFYCSDCNRRQQQQKKRDSRERTRGTARKKKRDSSRRRRKNEKLCNSRRPRV
jgi:hypothetical protein